MKTSENKGIESDKMAELKARIRNSGQSFMLHESDDRSDEYAHFYFIGKYKGQEVLYDAVLTTLRLQHESELFEIAEHRAAKHFPHFKKISYREDENGNMQPLDRLEEEIGLYMAEVIMELEEEDQVKVKEHVELDPNIEYGIGLDAGLNVEAITPKVIDNFIRNFNADTLSLDPTWYSFQTEEETAKPAR